MASSSRLVNRVLFLLHVVSAILLTTMMREAQSLVPPTRDYYLSQQSRLISIQQQQQQRHERRPPRPTTTSTTTTTTTTTRLQDAATAMGQGMELYQIVVAGSLAGAIGIGVAYPFDTIKTKQLILNGGGQLQQQLQQQHPWTVSSSTFAAASSSEPTTTITTPLAVEGTVAVDAMLSSSPITVPSVLSTPPLSSLAPPAFRNSTSSWDTIIYPDFGGGASSEAALAAASSSSSASAEQQGMVLTIMDASGTLALAPTTSTTTMTTFTTTTTTTTTADAVLASATAAASDLVASALSAVAAAVTPMPSPTSSGTGTMATTSTTTTTGSSPEDDTTATVAWNQEQSLSPSKYSIVDVMAHIYQNEGGITGFFGGVQSMMIGQAIIKALTFTVNAMALQWLQQEASSSSSSQPFAAASSSTSLLSHMASSFLAHQHWSQAQILFLAAGCAGFMASFVTAPVERICCIMQSQQQQSPPPAPPQQPSLSSSSDSTAMIHQPPKYYASEWDCLRDVIQQEGLWGWLLGSGWVLSLWREMPSDMIYFALYGMLTSRDATQIWLAQHPHWTWLAPLLFGALSGMASWIPVYPVDVVKTIYQAQPKPSTKTTTITKQSVELQFLQQQQRQQQQQQEQLGSLSSSTTTPATSTTVVFLSPWEITQQLWQQGRQTTPLTPWSPFWQGLDAKLIRAAVHHAVTFCVFDAVLKLWQAQPPTP
ncbi:hypothetical protein ACA910_000078 [Epithemia clementina (nom. ined.)]